ncbi:hypothetical protein VTN02DRAFT_1877 [Thermoascus thermophilus]
MSKIVAKTLACRSLGQVVNLLPSKTTGQDHAIIMTNADESWFMERRKDAVGDRETRRRKARFLCTSVGMALEHHLRQVATRMALVAGVNVSQHLISITRRSSACSTFRAARSLLFYTDNRKDKKDRIIIRRFMQYDSSLVQNPNYWKAKSTHYCMRLIAQHLTGRLVGAPD